MKVILETERLLLRKYVEGDAEAFFKLNTDRKVLRFVPDKALLNLQQARQVLIDHPIADYQKHGFGRGACILKTTSEQIGFAGLRYLEELREVDAAYRLMPAYWDRSCHAAKYCFHPGPGKSRTALYRNGDVLGTRILKYVINH